MGDMKQVPYRGPTNIRRHRTNFGRHGDLAPGICVPLLRHEDCKCVSGLQKFKHCELKWMKLTHVNVCIIRRFVHQVVTSEASPRVAT